METRAYRFAGFELDLGVFELRRGGRVVPVGPRGFDVLRYLIENRERVVEKEQLIGAVWAAAVGESALPRCMSVLRQALGDDGSIIHTVRGRGYRFVAPVEVEADSAPDARPSLLPMAGTAVERSAGFVGRDDVLGELENALERSMEGSGRLILLHGEPGIGKTATVRELGRIASARGALVVTGRGYEAAETTPFWPWVEALRALVSRIGRDELERCLSPGLGAIVELLPELQEMLPIRTAPPMASPDRSRFLLFDATRRFVESLSKMRPLVIVLDDLHCADAASLHLLEFIARGLSQMRLLVLGTYRDTDLSRQAGITDVLATLSREIECQRISLFGLTLSEVRDLIAKEHGANSPRVNTAEIIHAHTAGNPLFVAELVRSLAARNESKGAPGAAPLPPRVIDAIRERLAALSPAATAMIEVASVAGHDVPAALLVAVSGASRVEVLTAIDEAVRARVLRRRSNTYAFVHAIVRDAVYENMTDVRRMMLHRAYAEALEASAPVVELDLAALAHHYHSSAPTGTADKAFVYARSAGRFALRAHAPEQAADLLARSVELAETERLLSPQERLDLLLELGEAQIQARRRLAARETFERAAAAARTLSDRVRFARATIGFAGDCELFVPRDPTRLGLLEEARRWLAFTDDLELSSLVASVLSGTSPYWEDLPGRRALSAEALELGRRSGSTRAVLRALWARCAALLGPDYEEQYLSAANEMLELSRASGEPIGEIEALDALLVWHVLTGDPAAIARSLESMERIVHENHFPLWAWWTRSLRTTMALIESRFEDARHLLEESEAVGALLDNPIVPPTIAGQRLELAFITGEFQHVGDSLDCLRHHSGGDRIVGAMMALAAAVSGDSKNARSLINDAFPGDLTDIPRDESWLLIMSLLGDAIALSGDTVRMQLCYDLLSPYEDWNAVHLLTLSHSGPIARILGQLTVGLERPVEARQHFERALEMTERSGARSARCAAMLNFAALLWKSGAAHEMERGRSMAVAASALANEVGAKLLSQSAAALMQTM